MTTIWSVQSKSPDGQWLSSAKTEQHSGPGNASLQTLVYIEPTNRSASPEVVLTLSPTSESRSDMNDLEMKWLTPTHLEIGYDRDLNVDFEVARAFGIDVTYGPR